VLGFFSSTTFFGISSAFVWVCLLGTASIASGIYANGFMRDEHEVTQDRGADVRALITSLLALVFLLFLASFSQCAVGGDVLAFRPV
jgi:hypothetical protein